MIKKSTLFTICFLLSGSLAAQWTQGKGNAYVKLSGWYLKSDSHFTNTGEIAALPTRVFLNTSLYAEYGLSKKIDLVTYFPFFARSLQNNQVSGTRGTILEGGEGASLKSLGDLDIGVKYGIYTSNNWAVSTSLTFGIPTGKTDGGHETAVLQNGDGEFNQQIKAAIGHSFQLKKMPGYAKSYVAYNHRTQGFSDEVSVGAEVGLYVLKPLLLTSKLNLLRSTKNGTLSESTNTTSLFANNIEYTNVGVQIAYFISKNIGVSYEYTALLNGKIIAAAPNHSVGVFVKLH
ncbi:hypothetical protein [uncultured Polaribacter sp.]|uniref:hypothetical protein n=1 Tax=uncultured Polaribacter sp. TaxID=174711 RepID=UPI00261C29CA|nr:hypothetical protein [uncultured Polaribacter sp.]